MRKQLYLEKKLMNWLVGCAMHTIYRHDPNIILPFSTVVVIVGRTIVVAGITCQG
jgi:hypothetical protein